MLKTGFIGTLTDDLFNSISLHPGFELTGINNRYSPGNYPVPRVSDNSILENSQAIIIEHPGSETEDLIGRALKRSKHLMLMDLSGLYEISLKTLLKLHSEARTVIKIRQPERNNPALRHCLPLVTHPSLFEIRLMTSANSNFLKGYSFKGKLLRMLDILLYLCPSNIQKVQSLRHPASISCNGLISSRLEFDNGSVANILSTGITENEVFCIDIYQKNMLLRVDILKADLHILESQANGEIVNSSSRAFKHSHQASFYNDLDSFYHSVNSRDTTGKDLFEISRLLELGRNITEKSRCSEFA